eukprot:TRINITY_DN643_c2_g2_i3.p1 TRINITY_DN643_c2_g2~~TRINITY_DN643_c2_g2_i3.p1  ORF type:complete len:1081 (-),score=322.65 TRINITY_DN643_c2_g2_i3:39-3260(-)
MATIVAAATPLVSLSLSPRTRAMPPPPVPLSPPFSPECPRSPDWPQAAGDEGGEASLEHEWVIWYDRGGVKGQTQAQYESSIKEIGSFGTVEEFWRYWNNVFEGRRFPDGSNVRVFKNGIRPTWEDPSNVSGGKWVVHCHKQVTANITTAAVLAVIGEQLPNSHEICGLVASFRSGIDSVSVWNSKFDRAIVSCTSEKLTQLLSRDSGISIKYQVHKEALDSNARLQIAPTSSLETTEADGTPIDYTDKKHPINVRLEHAADTDVMSLRWGWGDRCECGFLTGDADDARPAKTKATPAIAAELAAAEAYERMATWKSRLGLDVATPAGAVTAAARSPLSAPATPASYPSPQQLTKGWAEDAVPKRSGSTDNCKVDRKPLPVDRVSHLMHKRSASEYSYELSLLRSQGFKIPVSAFKPYHRWDSADNGQAPVARQAPKADAQQASKQDKLETASLFVASHRRAISLESSLVHHCSVFEDPQRLKSVLSKPYEPHYDKFLAHKRSQSGDQQKGDQKGDQQPTYPTAGATPKEKDDANYAQSYSSVTRVLNDLTGTEDVMDILGSSSTTELSPKLSPVVEPAHSPPIRVADNPRSPLQQAQQQQQQQQQQQEPAAAPLTHRNVRIQYKQVAQGYAQRSMFIQKASSPPLASPPLSPHHSPFLQPQHSPSASPNATASGAPVSPTTRFSPKLSPNMPPHSPPFAPQSPRSLLGGGDGDQPPQARSYQIRIQHRPPPPQQQQQQRNQSRQPPLDRPSQPPAHQPLPQLLQQLLQQQQQQQATPLQQPQQHPQPQPKSTSSVQQLLANPLTPPQLQPPPPSKKAHQQQRPKTPKAAKPSAPPQAEEHKAPFPSLPQLDAFLMNPAAPLPLPGVVQPHGDREPATTVSSADTAEALHTAPHTPPPQPQPQPLPLPLPRPAPRSPAKSPQQKLSASPAKSPKKVQVAKSRTPTRSPIKSEEPNVKKEQQPEFEHASVPVPVPVPEPVPEPEPEPEPEPAELKPTSAPQPHTMHRERHANPPPHRRSGKHRGAPVAAVAAVAAAVPEAADGHKIVISCAHLVAIACVLVLLTACVVLLCNKY